MTPIRPILGISRRYIRFNNRDVRLIHSSIANSANPVPHPTAPGPPPPVPSPIVPEPEERILRKRRQSELLSKVRNSQVSSNKHGGLLKKRFWKEVYVKGTPEGFHVLLDTRPVRTPSKDIIIIPSSKYHLATAIALEWDQLVSVQQALKQHHIPLTSLVSRAIDIHAADSAKNGELRDSIVTILLRYLNTDTLLCWAPEQSLHEPSADDGRETLRELQMRIAKPIIAHITSHVWPGVEVQPVLDTDSIVPTSQPSSTRDVVRGWLMGLPAFELAGLERAVLTTKSLLVSVRLLVEWSDQFGHLRTEKESGVGRFGIEEAAEACSLEVRWQTKQWGEVEDTHDVDKEDLRRQLGGVILLVHGD